MTSLIDRYVAAASDDFPGSDNASTARDVRAAVEDMVDAKLAAGLPQDQAERAAMEELGDPKQFAEQFQQEPRYLIGPKLFRPWWNTLRLVMAIVVPLFIALGALEFVSDGDGDTMSLVIEIIVSVVEGIIQAAFWVTLFFAIFQFTGGVSTVNDAAKRGDSWSADDLPDLQMGRQITISHIVMNLIPLVGASYLAMRFRDEGLGAFGLNKLYELSADTPVFNPELSSWWVVALFALLVVSLLVAAWSFMQGFWTQNVLFANLVDSGLWIAFVLLLANASDIINPAIIQNSGQQGDWWVTGENSNDVIIGILLIIIAWDIFDSVKGHLDYRKRNALK